MKNDPCRKSLPPRVNKFFRKGPLRPEKSKKKGLRSLGQKSHKMKNDPCQKSLPPRINKFFQKGPLKPKNNKKQKKGIRRKNSLNEK